MSCFLQNKTHRNLEFWRNLAGTPLCPASFGESMLSFEFCWVVTTNGLVAAEVYSSETGEIQFWTAVDAEDLRHDFHRAPVRAVAEELFLPTTPSEETRSDFWLEEHIPVYRPGEKIITPEGGVMVLTSESLKDSESHYRDLATVMLRNLYHIARNKNRAEAEKFALQVTSLYGEELGINSLMTEEVIKKGLSYNKNRKVRGLPPKKAKEAPEKEQKRPPKWVSKPKKGGKWKRNQANR